MDVSVLVWVPACIFYVVFFVFIIFCCCPTLYKDPDDVKVARNTLEKKSASDLANCMSALRKRADNAADVTLICQGKKFPVHKAILIGRSDVFSAMFSHADTTEATTNEVHIDDTDHDTLERFLWYVHIRANPYTSCICELKSITPFQLHLWRRFTEHHI